MSTWLITGCSSGLGRALAEAVLARGWNAVVTARDPAKIEDLVAAYPDTALAAALDVRDDEQVKAAVAQAEAKFDAVDVLVNNAGHGYRAAVEEADEAEVDELFAPNFFGVVAMIKPALPGMRARRRGTIVNVSSIAARNPAPGSGYYAATKCALEGLSGSLRKEVEPPQPPVTAPTGPRRATAVCGTGEGERDTSRSTPAGRRGGNVAWARQISLRNAPRPAPG